MKLRHEFEFHAGDGLDVLKEAINSIPPDATNVQLTFEDEWVGYGPSEHTEPYFSITWETT